MKAFLILLIAMLLVETVAGCRGSADETTARKNSTSNTKPTLVPFDSPRHGISLAHSADWIVVSRPDYVLTLVPREDENASSLNRSISLGIPKLPPHIPGFIPIGLVVSGYVDDMKEKQPGVTIDKPVETEVAGSTARLVRSRFGSQIEEAVLTVHSDRVYIFRVNCAVNEEAALTEVFDQILQTVKWK